MLVESISRISLVIALVHLQRFFFNFSKPINGSTEKLLKHLSCQAVDVVIIVFLKMNQSNSTSTI